MRISIKHHLLIVAIGGFLGSLFAYVSGYLPAIFGDLSRLLVSDFEILEKFYHAQPTFYYIQTSVLMIFSISTIFHTGYMIVCLAKTKRTVPVWLLCIAFFTIPFFLLAGMLSLIPIFILDIYYAIFKKRSFYFIPPKSHFPIEDYQKTNTFNIPILDSYYKNIKKYKFLAILFGFIFFLIALFIGNRIISSCLLLLATVGPFLFYLFTKIRESFRLYSLINIDLDSHAFYIAMHHIYTTTPSLQKLSMINMYIISLLYDNQIVQLQEIVKRHPLASKKITMLRTFDGYIKVAKSANDIVTVKNYLQEKELWIHQHIQNPNKRNPLVVKQLEQRLIDMQIDELIENKLYQEAIILLTNPAKYQKNMLEILFEKAKLGYCYYQEGNYHKANDQLLYVKKYGDNIALLKPYIELIND